jgi:Cu/Ag efflux protein CusF
MKKIIVLVSLLTLIAFVFGAIAQPKPSPAAAPAPAPMKFSGKIAKVDEMGKMIDVKGKVKKEGKTMTFAIDDMAKITKGKAEMKMADLKEGTMVSVEYKKESDKMIATAVKLYTPKAKPKAKAAPKE